MSDTQPLKARALNGQLLQRLQSPRDRIRLLETFAYKQSGRLLELGFGGGGFLSLAGEHFDVTGIDHSARRVRRLQPLLSAGMAVRQGEIEQEDFGRDHYDVVAVFNILEHLYQPAATVQKLYASLKDTGILIGSMPNNQPPIGSVVTALTNIGDRTHVSTYSPSRWHRVFSEAGFREITFFGEVLLTKYLPRYVRDPLWRYYAFNLMFVCVK